MVDGCFKTIFPISDSDMDMTYSVKSKTSTSWQRFRPRKGQIILSVLSGLMMMTAFPKADQGWLAWIAMVPLLLALRKADWRRGLAVGFISGLVHSLGLMYWTSTTMNVYGNLPMYQCVVILALLAACMALYFAVFGLVLVRINPRPWQLPFLAPAVWTATELLRATLFTGFPWELMGYSQYDHLWLVQWADLFGVYGLSGLIVMVNSVATLALLHWLDAPWRDSSISTALVKRAGIGALAVMATVTLYGALRVSAVGKSMAEADHVGVAVVQGNINQALKWEPSFQLTTTVKYKKLSMQAAAEKPDLIVWPETATPFYFLQDPILTRMVLEGIKDADADFIIGSPLAVPIPDSEEYTYRNTAYLMNTEGKVLGRYDKVRLVPFGEYVPLKRWLPFIKKLVAQVGDFKPGQRGTTLPWKTHPIGMQICYEVIFPELVRAMVDNGAQLLVNITNDAWFDRTSAAYQHFSMAVFRSVENRRSLVRAANTGISGFIAPSGRVMATTELFEDAAIVAQVPLMTGSTFYGRWGDWPVGLVVAMLLAPWAAAEAITLWKARRKRV
jgi:apolipoprotein N-acyltransferase